jgi:hypothetical protein
MDAALSYYARLGIAWDANMDDIRTAYHELCGRLHPDRIQDGAPAADMQAIKEAYRALQDPIQRADQDALLRGFGLIPAPMLEAEADDSTTNAANAMAVQSKYHVDDPANTFTWFDILGVQPTATPAQILGGYRERMGWAIPPDERELVQQAYAVLSNEAQRIEYITKMREFGLLKVPTRSPATTAQPQPAQPQPAQPQPVQQQPVQPQPAQPQPVQQQQLTKSKATVAIHRTSSTVITAGNGKVEITSFSSTEGVVLQSSSPSQQLQWDPVVVNQLNDKLKELGLMMANVNFYMYTQHTARTLKIGRAGSSIFSISSDDYGVPAFLGTFFDKFHTYHDRLQMELKNCNISMTHGSLQFWINKVSSLVTRIEQHIHDIDRFRDMVVQQHEYGCELKRIIKRSMPQFRYLHDYTLANFWLEDDSFVALRDEFITNGGSLSLLPAHLRTAGQTMVSRDS